MATSTLTSNGQITIPQAVREALGLQAGDKVDFGRPSAPGTGSSVHHSLVGR